MRSSSKECMAKGGLQQILCSFSDESCTMSKELLVVVVRLVKGFNVGATEPEVAGVTASGACLFPARYA